MNISIPSPLAKEAFETMSKADRIQAVLSIVDEGRRKQVIFTRKDAGVRHPKRDHLGTGLDADQAAGILEPRNQCWSNSLDAADEA